MMALRRELQFADEINEYIVLKLVLSDYRGTNRPMPPEAEVAHPNIRPKVRKDEKRLLRLYFRNWKAPYYGRLPGWRDDSPVYILWNGQLACGVYLCDKNEFDNDNGWGQLHYAFVDPRFKGKGLYSLAFKEAVYRAQSWGLKGLYLNSDRHLLPEIYERWGAVFWKKIPKLFTYTKHSNMGPHNWLVYKLHDEVLARVLRRYASGILVDIGCGEKPYAVMTEGLVTQHLGVDHVETQHNHSKIDIFASAYDTTLPDSSADTVLCTAVLEHLERPQDALREMHRILKPGGYVILSAPLF
ncbi:MAG: GNAT family N-acetyltransferase, partial [Candidatus Methanomethyliaceae archaeon]